MIRFSSENKKAELLGNTKKDEGCPTKFRSISIAHDLTIKQWDAVKVAITQAKENNKNVKEESNSTQRNYKIKESGHLWKPRNNRNVQLDIFQYEKQQSKQ